MSEEIELLKCNSILFYILLYVFIYRLVSISFHLCDLENKLIEAKMESLCSPLLSVTIVWFLREFSQAYLMPNETYYNEVNNNNISHTNYYLYNY